MQQTTPSGAGDAAAADRIDLHRVECEAELPDWCPAADLVAFFHDKMAPYEDEPEDIRRALDYAFSEEEGKGGFLVLAERRGLLVGALLMLATGMGGYVPAHLLLFVAVSPELRGHGVGRRIIEEACRGLDGAVKLHVEYENPAKRLYERLGFASKYAEMRYEA